MFLKIGPGALLFVKFIPGLSNITVSLAGVIGVRPIAFIPLQMLGASLYLGVPILLGRLFYRTLNVVVHGIDTMGKFGLLGIAAAKEPIHLDVRLPSVRQRWQSCESVRAGMG